VTDRPFAAACERNRGAILDRIAEEFATVTRVLEIGSGTGQHAAWFAPRLPGLSWVATDLEERLPGILAWLDEVPATVRPDVFALDVTQNPWPDPGPVDAAFSANTAHILPVDAVAAMFDGLGKALPAGAPFCLYGPFARGGRHTGPGNEAFDQALRMRDAGMGVRDLDWLEETAAGAGFVMDRVHPMPADNRLVVWRKH
jgi:SAM-dependent methyltransferase